MPLLHKEKVTMFYHNLVISDDGLYLTSLVNGVDMAFDEYTFSEILGALTVGIRSIRSGKGFAQVFGNV